MVGTVYLENGHVTRVEEGEPEGGVDLAMGADKGNVGCVSKI